MLRDGTVSVTAAAQGAHPGLALAWAAAGGAVAAPAHSTVTPLEPSVFARTSAATGTGTVTVTRTFTVDPAAAACTAAAQVGTAAVAVGTPAGARTLSAGVASGTTADVTVTCTHPGRSDAAAAVKLTARAADACEDFIGVLPVGLTARAGTIAADAGCVSAQRRENLNGRVYYARRHTFTLDAAATVTATHASAASAPRLDDPYLLLLAGHGTSGEVIDTDDDSGPGRAAQITAILDPGSYTLEATAFGTRRTGSYTLAIDSAAVTGCTTALGTLTAGQTTRNGGIERDSDCPSQQRTRSSRTPNYAHWHTFTLTQPAWIDIDLARPTGSGLNPYVILSRVPSGQCDKSTAAVSSVTWARARRPRERPRRAWRPSTAGCQRSASVRAAAIAAVIWVLRRAVMKYAMLRSLQPCAIDAEHPAESVRSRIGCAAASGSSPRRCPAANASGSWPIERSSTSR